MFGGLNTNDYEKGIMQREALQMLLILARQNEINKLTNQYMNPNFPYPPLQQQNYTITNFNYPFSPVSQNLLGGNAQNIVANLPNSSLRQSYDLKSNSKLEKVLPQSVLINQKNTCQISENLDSDKKCIAKEENCMHEKTDSQSKAILLTIDGSCEFGEKKTEELITGKINNLNKKNLVTKYFRCEYEDCNKIFPKEMNLKDHMRIHTGDKPYMCKYHDCDKAFAQYGNLKKHQKVHGGEKKFICDFDGCGKKFSANYNLKVGI
jgi:hypothetical protein